MMLATLGECHTAGSLASVDGKTLPLLSLHFLISSVWQHPARLAWSPVEGRIEWHQKGLRCSCSCAVLVKVQLRPRLPSVPRRVDCDLQHFFTDHSSTPYLLSKERHDTCWHGVQQATCCGSGASVMDDRGNVLKKPLVWAIAQPENFVRRGLPFT